MRSKESITSITRSKVSDTSGASTPRALKLSRTCLSCPSSSSVLAERNRRKASLGPTLNAIRTSSTLVMSGHVAVNRASPSSNGASSPGRSAEASTPVWKTTSSTAEPLMLNVARSPRRAGSRRLFVRSLNRIFPVPAGSRRVMLIARAGSMVTVGFATSTPRNPN